MLIEGRCHCGNIAFALDGFADAAAIVARACTCTFCTRHGAAWTSCPSGALRVAIADAAHATTYAFGTSTAAFHVCTRCGGVPLVTSDIDGGRFAVVNVRHFETVDPSLLPVAPATLDGEEVDARLSRRQRNWIGDVAFVTSSALADWTRERSRGVASA
jgi:hypothetical protein